VKKITSMLSPRPVVRAKERLAYASQRREERREKGGTKKALRRLSAPKPVDSTVEGRAGADDTTRPSKLEDA
jgi:hypothetical protein